jgi:hypothetical protein
MGCRPSRKIWLYAQVASAWANAWRAQSDTGGEFGKASESRRSPVSLIEDLRLRNGVDPVAQKKARRPCGGGLNPILGGLEETE